MSQTEEIKTFTAKDLITDQEVRWCPACGDYAILKAVQNTIPLLNKPKNEFVFVSGIGCSSRFPYYLNTYGFHSIHGRATAIASGLKITRPELSVWIITGDGDGLSIGGNHLIHLLRRNIDVNVLLFNNKIYGLTKGQYSPTSELGKITKSSPIGTADRPFSSLNLTLGSGATFVARTMDIDVKHQQLIYQEAYHHQGTSFVEIFQNCNVFNDGAFQVLTNKETKSQNTIYLEHGKPITFDNGKKVLELQDLEILIKNIEEANKPLIHNKHSINQALLLSKAEEMEQIPKLFGIIYQSLNNNSYQLIRKSALSDTEKLEKFQRILETNNKWTIK